ncbi:unnamed protein product [Candidula unifasciata]|uniref:G-protein coupled receptor GRL101 n=1 Tax=Candidula unifasciata TaxID=100452 RepID=A0A8S3ZE20_9EUPU|nr:unnamed protein product [Candidula unifasciata]
MQFFTSVVDIFLPPEEKTLNSRIRIYLLVATEDNVTGESVIQERKHFSSYTEKVYLKRALKKEFVEFKKNSNPMEAIPYLNAMSLNETDRIRKNTTLVIVMFGSHQNMNLSYSESDLHNDFDISDHNVIVKLFMLVLKDMPPDRLKLTSSVAIYKIADIRSDLGTIMSILMCKSCFLGWFGGASQSAAFGKTIGTSCYKLGSSPNQISWIDANELCKGSNSQLVSIETKTELITLRQQLNQQIEKMPVVEGITDHVSIYIGLRRLKSTVGKRFRWLNDHPLVYTHWGHLEPQGGSIRGCVKWDLFNLSYSSNINEELMNNSDKLLLATTKGTWTAVGCGHAVTKYYLCENIINVPLNSPSHHDKKFNLKVPDYESITRAIGRGEIGFVQNVNMFMSLSPLLKLWKSERAAVNGFAYVNHKMEITVALSEIKLYHCEGNDGKIPYTSVCDVTRDCPFALDETVCRKCNSEERECAASGQCIPTDSWCDLVPDCQDNSDEVNCDTCQHGLCTDGRCMAKSWFADGEMDCAGCGSSNNISYEMDYVQTHKIAHCLFTCNRTECVFQWMLNDSILHCKGPEGPIDETIGAFEIASCHTVSDSVPSQFSNWGPKCVYVKDIYGELLGCRNMRHLQGCENFTCPDGYYQCPQSYCIPTHYIRDGIMDCPHGADEDYEMQFLECPFYFMCQVPISRGNSHLCLHPKLVCDGRIDCPEGDDELNCFLNCLDGFRCLAGTMIVNDYKKAKTSEVINLIDPTIRYLDLSGINLSKDFPIFFRNGTINLIEVKMSNCSIVSTSLAVPTCNLGTIRRMDLSYNDITNISANSIFRCMTNLYDLNLSHNEKLVSLQGIEYEISKVKYLDLSYTGLAFLSELTFSFLKDVKLLNLRQTRITDVRFLPPTTIEILDLRDTLVNNLPYADMFKHVVVSVHLRTDSFKLCCPQLHNASTNISSCSFTKDPFSSCADLMSKFALRIILWAACILAVLGNLAVIIYRLFFDRSIFTMAYGHFVTHLSISDFFMGIYLGIIAIADIHFRDKYIWEEITWRKSIVCNTAGFLSTLSIEVSTMFIALITIDRFLVIRYPFGQTRIAGRSVNICCCITWIVGFSVALIPLLPFSHFLNIYNTNGMCLGLPLANYKDSGREFAITVFIFLNFSLFVLIAFGQVIIYRTVSAMRMKETSLTNSNSRRFQDLAVAKNLAVVAITNLLFWSPIGVMGIMVQSGYTIGIEAYAWTAVLILPINAAVNPLLYTVPAITRKLNKVQERTSS